MVVTGVILVLSLFLAALLPASLVGQFGQRSVDVVRGVAVVCGEEISHIYITFKVIL